MSDAHELILQVAVRRTIIHTPPPIIVSQPFVRWRSLRGDVRDLQVDPSISFHIIHLYATAAVPLFRVVVRIFRIVVRVSKCSDMCQRLVHCPYFMYCLCETIESLTSAVMWAPPILVTDR